MLLFRNPQYSATSAPLKVLLLFRQSSSSFTAYPWALAQSGKLLVDTVARYDHVIKHSAWSNEHYAFEDDENCITILKGRLATQEYAALYCMGAPALDILLEHRGDPILRPYLPYSHESEMFEILEDKQLFQEWCHSLDIPIPQSCYAQSASKLFLRSDGFRYPSVLKFSKGYGGQEVFVVHSKQEIEDTLAAHPPSAETSLILQDYIDGVVGTTLFVANKGKIYGCFSLEKVRRLCEGLGPTVACRFIDSQELSQFAAKIAMKSLVSGITGFDWVQSREGQYYVIDPHLGRATPNVIISHFAGIDLGDVTHASLVEVGRSQNEIVSNQKTIWLMPQALEYLFEPKTSAQAPQVSSPQVGMAVFWCGRNESKLFILQAAECIYSQMRITFGRWRRQLTGYISRWFKG